MSKISKAIKGMADKVNEYYEKKLKEDPNWKPENSTSEIDVKKTEDISTYSIKMNIK